MRGSGSACVSRMSSTMAVDDAADDDDAAVVVISAAGSGKLFSNVIWCAAIRSPGVPTVIHDGMRTWSHRFSYVSFSIFG